MRMCMRKFILCHKKILQFFGCDLLAGPKTMKAIPLEELDNWSSPEEYTTQV